MSREETKGIRKENNGQKESRKEFEPDKKNEMDGDKESARENRKRERTALDELDYLRRAVEVSALQIGLDLDLELTTGLYRFVSTLLVFDGH